MSYQANIQLKVDGLSAAEKLEKLLVGIESRIQKINKTALKVKAAATGGGNSQAARATRQVQRNTQLIKEQTDLRLRQIRLVSQKTNGLRNQAQVMNTLRTATDNILSDQQESIRLGQAQLQNARAMVTEETNRVREIDKANKLLAQQAKQRGQRFEESVRSGTVPGGGGNGGALAAAAGFGLAQSIKGVSSEIDAIRSGLAQSTTEGKALSKTFAQIEDKTAKIKEKRQQQVQVQSEINSLTRQQKFLTASTQRAIDKKAKDAGTLSNKLKEVTKELNNQRSRLRGNADTLQRWNREVRDLKNNYRGVYNELDKIARKQVETAEKAANKARNKGNRGKAVLAGAAFAPIPGQDIAQAAGAGALVAGPKGAAIAAVTAVLAKSAVAFTQFSKSSAQATAEFKRFQAALLGTVPNLKTYNQALDSIKNISDQFQTPIDQVIQNFTKLNAAVTANGLTVKDTEKVYKGLAAANSALGGDAEKLNGILLATQQVFSKGKVTAEELRGQIGERLPGAFALFARSAGLSTQELDKALSKGEVTVQDFVTFTDGLLEQYGENAKIIADAPETAGQRLEKALKDMQITWGSIFADMGATVQDWATEVVKWLDWVGQQINKWNIQAAEALVNRTIQNRDTAAQRLADMRENMGTGWGQVSARELAIAEQQYNQAVKYANDAQKTLNDLRKRTTAVPPTRPGGGDDPPVNTEPPTGDTPVSRTVAKRSIASLLDTDALRQLRERTQRALNQNQIDINAALEIDNQSLVKELERKRLKIPLELEIQQLKDGIQSVKDNPQKWLDLYQADQMSLDQAIKDAETQLAVREAELKGTTLQIQADIIRDQKQQVEDRKTLNQELQTTIDKYQNIYASQAQNYINQQQVQRLIAEGVNPALAEQLIEIDNIAAAQLKILDADIAIAEAEKIKAKASGLWTDELEKQLDLLKAQRGLIGNQAQDARNRAEQRFSPEGRLTDAVNEAQNNLRQLQDPINLVIKGANAIGDAFGTAFSEIINGTKSAQQAFADMLNKVANSFIDAATQMIAQYVKLILMQTVLNALGGPSLGGNMGGENYFSPITGKGVAGPNFGLASGGRALGGNTYVVGERGPEVVTFDSPATVSSNRAFDAARDSMSMDADTFQQRNSEERQQKLDEAASEFYQSSGKPVQVETVMINEYEFTTPEQVQKAVQAGVLQSRASTLRDLRNMPGKRAQIGLR